MFKNTLSKTTRGSANRFKVTSFEKRMMLLDQMMADNASKDYNPRKARNRSLKGIVLRTK
jgi:hypothetical protein